MSEKFTLNDLATAVSGSAAALRSVTILQPVGGEGDKVFPATFANGEYAKEKRRDHAAKVELECVLLDSVASQANRAEESLLNAIRRYELKLPLIEVDFTDTNKKLRTDLPNLTSLEVPHRLADAILRDSQLADGTRFSKSEYAAQWGKSSPWNATAVYKLCPTALVFGMWGSPDKPGGLGAKFERAYVSEIVGIDTTFVEKRLGFRIDPVGTSSKVAVIRGDGGTFTLAKDAKAKEAVRPSEINHGNIGYDSAKDGIRFAGAGVRFARAEQTTVVSLGALRKLRFPLNGKEDQHVNNSARTALAALALCAGVLVAERGTSLRSRCHLWPVSTRQWEILEKPGQEPRKFTLSGEGAIKLLNEAVAAAELAGIEWRKEKLSLTPTPEFAELVRRSQEVQAKDGGEGEAS
jgi:CRISPR-associated protein Csb1